MIDHIENHADGSITIYERTAEGTMLGVTYPPEAAHDELVRRGAKCREAEHGHRVKTTETEFVTVELDDLSPETRAEVEAQATLTDTKSDRAELRRLRDEFDTAWESRIVSQDDMVDIESRNERIDRADARMKYLREQIALLEACVAIADLDAALNDEGE